VILRGDPVAKIPVAVELASPVVERMTELIATNQPKPP